MSAAAAPLDALESLFALRGAISVTMPIIQPAEPYLDTAGEALRRRIYLTRGEAGENLCLRPDFTIPVCLHHIARNQPLPYRYSYRGLVFRQPRYPDAPRELEQAGIEDLGETNLAVADARALADTLAACEALEVPLDGIDVILGDQGLFEAFLSALGLPDGWQRRLIRTFGEDRKLERMMEALSNTGSASIDNVPEPLLELARAREEGALIRAIRDRMEEAGLPPHSGRSPQEVAQRLIEKVATAEGKLTPASTALLRRFLEIDCALSDAARAVRSLAENAGLDLGRALSFFEARNLALQAAGVDLSAITYRAAFGRPIDYYTGMVFDLRPRGETITLAGGGRYDRLLTLLGAAERIPAVGFSLWMARLEAHRENARERAAP
ncbi:ATP phosphoribosyltransferase regulatory subunit [Fulvimarina sp. 2208YS6-2-32]|uniref:ATP phosphoribosyltransferase regulatory subunit n=1 Tax=Fulvimarina uroteuthidis TaxID=3098149 RepID=A0ABU5HYA9_9HYPH|nr:ATP phosphoribosyltransferase regulatory subunit [Fulvimarina sp. 2208YS6-2-32]MDY8107951.1 ATP phosphoribosyltransferase regulatory subunit [Fulvimarina sp. 2208YS6-2-32]